MSADRVVYSFVLAWVVLIAVLVVLDWLGNPNRGSFRPKGDAQFRDRATRKADRERQRLDDDALIRSTLRDAYGASSLRLGWSNDDEELVRQLDDTLILEDVPDHVLDAPSRVIADRAAEPASPVLSELDEIDEIDEAEVDALSDEAEVTPEEAYSDDLADDLDTSEPAPVIADEAEAAPSGWRLGDDPLALTAKGTAPAPATVRSRVWKNLATGSSWSDENRDRMQRGLPPLRSNPVTGEVERASVDIDTGQPSWGDVPIDPFAGDE